MVQQKPFKLSPTSRNTYVSCQRKFWHQYMNKTDKDDDYIEPVFFRFGRACHECLEAMKYHGKNNETALITSICHKHNINKESDIAKVMACVRGYFAQWYQTEAISIEAWIENESVTGKLDAVARYDSSLWILENKFFSEISPSLDIELPFDSQLCLYASRIDLIAAKLQVEPSEISGVIFRVIEKPKEKQKKTESMLEYAARCTTRAFEWRAPLARLKTGEAFGGFKQVLAEIATKYAKEEFLCNTKECVQYKVYSCPFYSQCHDIAFSQRKDETFNSDLF